MLNRRLFCAGLGATIAARQSVLAWARQRPESGTYKMVAEVDRSRILQAAEKYLPEDPVTVTSFVSPKSPGGPHDFFSQADYFWPNPKDPNGPYINRDGQSNPENFDEHRRAMVNLSLRMPALTAAWLLTKEQKYAKRSGDHLRAWFVTPETRMNPNLEFSQGVHGISTGRNYGIIDTLHVVEVARAASFLGLEALSASDRQGVKQWFREYLDWLKTSDKGKQERATLNNHATCWALQASEFARLIGDEGTRDEIRGWFTGTLLPDQLGKDGSFPKELARTKPYSYSIFNFDVMAGLAQSLKAKAPDLTTFALPDGRGLCKAAEFLFPYLKDKSKWPYAKDVEHFDSLPVRSPGLLFAGVACHREDYIALWKTLNPDPTDKEIIRNYPIRQPLLWV
ncbi:alginate lyase family protein [Edaphobacter aggregans]|uniref:alginate lyase family protein n=1 Tax=Edaphobacter aggregans TaxID=570835 RepID=UPI000556CEB5|nr:alginate lyase family protein [Edaphobacter aggregans]